MSAFEFMGRHPVLTFFLALLAYYTVVTPVRLIVRHMNIKSQGWPPEWCDADGDIAEKPASATPEPTP